MTKSLKQGDLVTVAQKQDASNVYILEDIVGNNCYLKHPSVPSMYIKKSLDQVNEVGAKARASIEYCMGYCVINKPLLDFNNVSLLDSLCMYFYVNKKLSSVQKQLLSNICGEIAAIKCDNDLSIATKYINEYKGLLDAFNSMWAEKLKLVITGDVKSVSKKQRASIFNITGFILAQLHE